MVGREAAHPWRTVGATVPRWVQGNDVGATAWRLLDVASTQADRNEALRVMQVVRPVVADEVVDVQPISTEGQERPAVQVGRAGIAAVDLLQPEDPINKALEPAAQAAPSLSVYEARIASRSPFRQVEATSTAPLRTAITRLDATRSKCWRGVPGY